ncbi:hypothetical protein BK634_17195 [Pseudomonas chlororaphis]|nr:hypothetical protein BK634_17195 [Pseudomonas chlororaphis]
MSDSQPAAATFEPIPTDLLAQMHGLRAALGELIASLFPGAVLTGTGADFPLLQQMVDSQTLAATDEPAWEAMGIALGDALVTEVPGLAWVQVSDEFGVDPVLRYRQTSLQIGVLTLLLKRAEQGEEIDIQHIANWLQKFIETKADEYQ